ncbi:P-loop containing nucleoside triphosphate hydrolase protein [Pelagophyceae sp. CCMP2097]|nr:P-loop containing nucleoside triphosphate hydrolase protein [Pelagophyceae sp. CCMP2097]
MSRQKSSHLMVHRAGVDDMTLLTKTDPNGIKDNLKERLQGECIYTYIGHVLVAMNPFTWLELYSPQDAARYQHCSRLDVPPHVFAIAEAAFRAMADEEESQCVIISGESGAGKTEASKHIQSYLALCSAGKGSAEVERVKRVFLESNPLLEAFGNAKTLRNNNSSRFGKYFELLFDRFGTPKGGVVTNYLLEKSRAVKPGAGERNFHIFYQLLAGAAGNDRKKFGLTGQADDFASLATCTTVEGVDDGKDYAETRRAMKDVQLPDSSADMALKIVSACLALSRLAFKPLAVGDAEGSQLDSGAATALAQATGLLSIDEAALRDACASRTLETMAPGGKTETYNVPLNATQAALTRDALLKSVYAKLFDALVLSVNEALDPQDADDGGELLSIGVLDIYGFEIFKKNGFEQLSINFVNEKLQQIFIALTLKAEQEEYVSEGIAWTEVKFFNNRIVCDLIESKKPPGVLLVLDDVCKQMHSRPGAQVDAKFLDTVASCHGSHAHFAKTKQGFVVKHYAGDVEYDAGGFAQSNRDELRAELLDVMLASGDASIRALYSDDAALRDAALADKAAGGRGKAGGGSSMTAGRKIREQCSALVTALMLCEPHYVRCVKSNDDKQALVCDDTRVAHQCKYLGLPENVRVRRAGFAYRTDFHRFLDRFKVLSPKTYPKEWTGSDKAGAQEIVRAAAQLEGLAILGKKEETQFGRSKLFVKAPETYFALEKARERKFGEYVSKIARAFRRARDARDFVKMAHVVAQKYGRKRRRASSVTRPFSGDYLKDDAARRGLRDMFKFVGDDKRLVFCDDGVRQLVKGTEKGVATKYVKRIFAVTSKAAYLVEDCGAGAPRRFQLRRAVPLDKLKGLSVSDQADDVVVLHCDSTPPPAANKAELLQSGKWEKNADVKVCPATGLKFSMFERRHHCRASGRIFSDKPTEAMQLLPDLGWFTPQRVAADLVGLHADEPLEDLVLSLERRTEAVGVLLRCKQSLRLSVSAEIRLGATPVASMDNVCPATSLRFVDGGRECSEAVPPKCDAANGVATLSAPPGVSESQVRDRQRRADDRRAIRAEQRAAERQRRQQRDAERNAQRSGEWRARLVEKKAKKAADRADRARAAGATNVSAAPRKFGSGKPRAAVPQREAQQRPAAREAPSSRVDEPAAYAPSKPAKPPMPPPPFQKPNAPPPMRAAAPKPPAHVADAEYYWQSARSGEQSGPSSFDALCGEYRTKNFNGTCLVYAGGVADEWKKLDEVPDLKKWLQAADDESKPAPAPAPAPAPYRQQPAAAAPAAAPYRQQQPPPSTNPRPAAQKNGGGSASDELAAKLAKRRAAADAA